MKYNKLSFYFLVVMMKKSIHKLFAKIKPSQKPVMRLENLEKKIEPLSLSDKKKLLKNIHQMYIKKSKYVPQSSSLKDIEHDILDMMVSKNKEDVAELVLLLSFSILPLKDKMRVEYLLWDFIDDDQYPKEDFEKNLLSIIDEDFILAAEVYKNYLPSLYEENNLFSFWKKVRDIVLKEQLPLSLHEVSQLQKEVFDMDKLHVSPLSENILSSLDEDTNKKDDS